MGEEELLVQVDENDNIIGAQPRSKFNNGKLIHRSSYLIILNSEKEILLQQRPISKKWHPGKWTFSVTGSVLTGETYEDCMNREVKKTLGKLLDFKELLKYHHFDNVDKAFEIVYLAKNVIDTKSKKTNYAWVNLDELRNGLEKNPEKYAPPFITGMKIIFKKHLLEPYL